MTKQEKSCIDHPMGRRGRHPAQARQGLCSGVGRDCRVERSAHVIRPAHGYELPAQRKDCY
jgi:hypothetical protein